PDVSDNYDIVCLRHQERSFDSFTLRPTIRATTSTPRHPGKTTPGHQLAKGRARRQGWLAVWGTEPWLWGRSLFPGTRAVAWPARSLRGARPSESPGRYGHTLARPPHSSPRRLAGTPGKFPSPPAAPWRRPADGRRPAPSRGEYSTPSRVEPRHRKASRTQLRAATRYGLRQIAPA